MASADRVLITGGTGFVGSAIARVVAERGFALRVLVRPSRPRTNLEGLPCEIAEGDMMDAKSMMRALKDVRYLFHVAADYRLWASDPREIVHNNLEGTSVVMKAALASGIEKIVYTSSVATLKPRADGEADENARLAETDA